MTVIAALWRRNTPFLIGDALVTSGRGPSPVADLGTGDELPDTGYRPADFAQKIEIVTENLGVAWSGTPFIVASFVRSLRMAIEKLEEVTVDEVMSLTSACIQQELSTELGRETGLIFLYCDDQKVSTWGHNVETVEIAGYENVLVGGSGRDVLVDALTGFEQDYSDSSMPDYMTATLDVMSAVTQMVGLDLLSNRNTSHLAFGAGYEVASRIDSRVAKFDDLLFGRCHITSEDEIGLATRIAKFDYADDHLVIRVYDHSRAVNGRLPEVRVATASPVSLPKSERRPPEDLGEELIVREVEQQRLTGLDRGATWTGVLLTANGEGDDFLIAPLTFWRPLGDGPIKIDLDSTVISFEDELMEAVRDQWEWFQSRPSP